MGFFKNLSIDLKASELATPDQFVRAVESNLGQKIEVENPDGALTLGAVLKLLAELYQGPS